MLRPMFCSVPAGEYLTVQSEAGVRVLEEALGAPFLHARILKKKLRSLVRYCTGPVVSEYTDCAQVFLRPLC